MKRSDSLPFGLILSVFLHGVVLLLFGVGLPSMRQTPLEPPRSIPIHVVTVDQISQAPRRKAKPEKKSTPTTPPHPPPSTPLEEKPQAEKVQKEAPAAPLEREVPLISREEKPTLPKEALERDQKFLKVPLPEKKVILETLEKKSEKKRDRREEKIGKKEEKRTSKEKVQNSKGKASQKKEPKEREPKEKGPNERVQNDFLSVLKNIEASKGEDAPDFPETDSALSSKSAADNVSDHLTISEIDLIKRQLAACWNIPAGAKDANDLIVVLDLEMNPDGTVKKASVIEGQSSSRHPFYRACAESALRAVRNPKCIPLKLPLSRYDSWKTLEIIFSPKDMP